ncbi:MAG TPA: endonuclease/exonuclease/phosphatase family protein [Opitutales bacterium]|nr:endonuclease/exonuclease/phosphatase family protein [Opitutales bacterium]
MTFNIAHGRGLGLYQGFTSPRKLRRNISAIAELVRGLKVSIAAFQEIDESSHWHHGLRMMETLKIESAFPNALMGVNNRRGGDKPLAYGNALFTSLPVELWDNQPFGGATLGEKGFLYAELSLGGPYLLPIVNLHLDFRSRKRRIVQVEKMLDYMRARPERPDRIHLPPVVCGDFNSSAAPQDDAVQHLFRHLVEASGYMLFPLETRTFPSYFPRRGIDFVFIPGSFRVLECTVVPAMLSDHRPVLVDFDIPSVR